ncbi:MAG: hypothetical protein JSS32_03075 [Verrucomicrobia bacterium]|nr:hypothetical protein [Verrucomicrobiota bacterium]
MKNFLICLFVVCASTAFSWGLKTGTYDLVGYNANGSTYYGEVVIAPQGDNYSVTWRVGSNQAQLGVGIHRDWDSVFSVAFADLSKNFWGVASYKIGVFGELEGAWCGANGSTQGTEILKWRSYSIY